jgi:Flp pilus assembly protein TadG
MNRMRNTKIGSERGQTITEFALILPIFIALLFGIIQFGIAFNNYVTLTDAARAGARKAAVSRNSNDPSGDCKAAVLAAAPNLDQSKLAPTVQCISSWDPGSDVEVDASYPYSINLFGFVVKSGNLTTQMKERVE